MPLEESHQLFRQTCQRFAKEKIAPHAFEWEEAGEFPRSLYKDAAQAGILGASYPAELGGGGGDLLHGLVGIEGLLTGGSSGVVAGLGSAGIALPPILNLGSDEQKRQFIPPILAGDKIAALAITEPGAGSDVAGIRTRAERRGDDYILNGSKLFITSGVRADLITVLARTGDDQHGGLTFFIVERGMPGFSVSRALKKTGWWASDTAELAFEDVRVPKENRIGEEGQGFVALMQNFQHERLALAFYGHATAAVALEDALTYAKERQAFGRPLVGFQVTRHKLAVMATQVTAARSFNHLHRPPSSCRRILGRRNQHGEEFLRQDRPRSLLPSRADLGRHGLHERNSGRASEPRRSPIAHRWRHHRNHERDHRQEPRALRRRQSRWRAPISSSSSLLERARVPVQTGCSDTQSSSPPWARLSLSTTPT